MAYDEGVAVLMSDAMKAPKIEACLSGVRYADSEVAAERERCAKIAEVAGEHSTYHGSEMVAAWLDACDYIAAEIRRGK